MDAMNEKHRDAILRLGSNSIYEAIDPDILKDLGQMGIVSMRPDGKLDFTPAGEAMLRTLKNAEQRPAED